MLLTHKGVDPVKINDFCNYIYTTNNDNPVHITTDDRRFQIIECSDMYKGNPDYWDKLYKAFDDESVCKTFFEYLKNRDISKFRPESCRVTTDATRAIQDANKGDAEHFADWLMDEEGYGGEGKHKFNNYQIYSLYKEWFVSSGRKDAGKKLMVDNAFAKKFKIVRREGVEHYISGGKSSYRILFKAQKEEIDLEEECEEIVIESNDEPSP